MCLTIPVKIVSLEKHKATVDFAGKKQKVDIQLVDNIKKGDYALISNGFIIKKVSAKEAKEILKTIQGG